MPTIAQIIAAIEEIAPLLLQEEWDNSGLQVGHPEAECTGAMLALDPTEWALDEAIAQGCNLLVTHHPLLFHAPKQYVGATAQQRTVERALRAGVAIYSAHTSLDNAPAGLCAHAARLLGLTAVAPLIPSPAMAGAGSGAVGSTPRPMTSAEFIEAVKGTFGSPVVRCSRAYGRYEGDGQLITRVALCTGSGGSFIPQALASGAQAYLTSDTRYHDFLDSGSDTLLIADIGHYESEKPACDIFYDIISKKFPNFAVRYSFTDVNPILYA
ncbi:MAG: Nif3-like dinuclear metal center hexameric protein [Pseudoflavonifractor sp.]|nr:Nif3-like dinuclear metal center hexameric protein [Alloprevotella sp.]MCM1116454.1 Nif3-like dinuclear metal center hexameric protein [Pseudoflavonifractor sp.]